MREYRVQGSSSVYTVRENGGNFVCYAETGALCPGWKNSKGSVKECKHTRAAKRGDVVDDRTDTELHEMRVARREPSEAKAELRTKVAASADRFVKPMLASKMESATITAWHEWAIEEKFDGHRAIVMVSGGTVTAWSRSGKSRKLPSHIVAAFSTQPNGIYDGELMGREGGDFADVRRVETQHEAYFSVFDIINSLGENVTGMSYDNRRSLLLFRIEPSPALKIAESRNLSCEADVVAFVSKVWERGGEGAILKRRAARYQAGARSADFVKVKKGGSRLVKVTGFEAGKRGPYSSVLCVDPTDGMETSVKNESKIDAKPSDVGRMLWIDYTEKTAEAFVNPHADRWEDR